MRSVPWCERAIIAVIGRNAHDPATIADALAHNLALAVDDDDYDRCR
jgi:hypothetical protein